MLQFVVLGLCHFCVLLVSIQGVPQSTCQDFDTRACAVFHTSRPDLCADQSFAHGECKRFCGQCPLECYSCQTPVLDPAECNTTSACAPYQVCMTKHLKPRDGGPDQYIMMCGKKEICDILSVGFAFGKRTALFDTEMEDSAEYNTYNNEMTLSCCGTDFCNMPTKTATTTTMATTTLQPTSPKRSPHGCHKDIVFLVDDSSTVGDTNFRHALDFVQIIVQKIEIGPTKAQVSLLTYSTHPQVGWFLNRFDNKHDILNAITKVHFLGGITNTNEALETVRTQLLTRAHGDRPEAENVVVVFTDGLSGNHVTTILEAIKLTQVSKDVITISIGSKIDSQMLNAIATDTHHIFDLRSYSLLTSILSHVLQVICN